MSNRLLGDAVLAAGAALVESLTAAGDAPRGISLADYLLGCSERGLDDLSYLVAAHLKVDPADARAVLQRNANPNTPDPNERT